MTVTCQSRQSRRRRLQGVPRDVDQVNVDRDLRNGRQDDLDLFAVAAAQFDDGRFVEPSGHGGGDFARVLTKQSGLGPGDPVLPRQANRIEQAQAERVVQVARLELLRRALQIAHDVGGGERVGEDAFRNH